MLTLDKVTLRQGEFILRADWATIPGITAIIGVSGGGKSTLLSAIAGFLVPASGQISYEGKDLAGVAPGDRPISTLFQDNNLFPHLSVAQNVGLALSKQLALSGAHRAQIDAVLGKVGLTGLAERKPEALSGGQQSRAALARVLLADRPVVLLDEPFAALGPGLRHDMLDLVGQVLGKAGKAVLMVTHDPDDAKRVADQVVLVSDGFAYAPVETGKLFDDPPAPLRVYLGQSKG